MPAAPAAACEGGAASPRAHPPAQAPPARYAILVAGEPDDAICARQARRMFALVATAATACRRRGLTLASALAPTASPSPLLLCSKGTFEQMFLELLAEQPLSVTTTPSAAAPVGDEGSSGHPSAAAAAAATGAAPVSAPAEEWSIYFAFKGQLPTTEELAGFRGIVITGSV